MQQWEYLCPVINAEDMPYQNGDGDSDPNAAALQKVLSRLGSAGWELVSGLAETNTYILKRPRQGDSTTQG